MSELKPVTCTRKLSCLKSTFELRVCVISQGLPLWPFAVTMLTDICGGSGGTFNVPTPKPQDCNPLCQVLTRAGSCIGMMVPFDVARSDLPRFLRPGVAAQLLGSRRFLSSVQEGDRSYLE